MAHIVNKQVLNKLSTNDDNVRPKSYETFLHKILPLKDIFGPWMSIGQGKLLTKNKSRFIQKKNHAVFLRAYLGLSLKRVALNIFFIAIFFCRNIV